MAGVVAQSASTVMNGSRSAYDTVQASQENTSASKSRPVGLRQNSTGSSRMPLSTLAPTRRGTNDSGLNGRPAHARVEELGQHDALARSGSEADSLLDLYRTNPSSGNVSAIAVDNDIPENMYRPQDEDPEGWIHRDKLAKIESEELQAAGINLANARRNGSRGPKRDSSRGRKSEERALPDYRRRDEDESKPVFAEPVEEEDERRDWDLRTAEEIAADNAAASQLYANPVLRKSGSKIPVLTSSPLPIAQERIERDTPLPRKRTMSNSLTPEEGTPVVKMRARKGSSGSQPMLDEYDDVTGTYVSTNGSKSAPKTTSPTKTKPKAISNTTPNATTNNNSPPSTSVGRKTSGAGAMRKTSTNTKAATSSPNARPSTRAGDLDRPRTAVNRPEGDPPWLATMYRPDPMLPPDQQIIPTHARKQQQAQWDDEGAIPKTYDRNFSPLAIHTSNGLVKETPLASPQPPGSPEKGEPDEKDAWPLKPAPGGRNSGSGRPGTGNSNGGYSTMPRVASPAILQSPQMGSISSTPGVLPQRMHVQRIEHNDADEKAKDKGCGCCIVM